MGRQEMPQNKANLQMQNGNQALASEVYDIAIIGAGIVGAMLAYQLVRYDKRVIVLDKGLDIALGATKANSGIIHAGYDPKPGTLKASLNVRGNALYDQLSSELSFGFRRTGSLTIATTQEECSLLGSLLDQGVRNQVQGMSLLDRSSALNLEPRLTPRTMRALYAPSTGIVDPWEVAIACMESAVDQGVTLRLASEVTAILTPEAWHDDFVIDTTTGNVRARSIINAAGVHAGKISALLNDRLPEFEIQPRRGQYFVLDKSTRGLVDHVIYPAPTSLGKGVLVIPTLHGNLLIGPDAETLPHEALEATQTTAKGLAFVRERAERLVPGLPFQLTVASFSGIRAESSQGDFILRESENFPRVFHAAGIKSPGLSAAPAIAEYILEHLKDVLPDWRENPDFTPGRRPRPVLSQATQEEKAALIATDPAFSHIVCRCEMVSEAEIVDCIRRSVGATTLNGVKRRVRPGGGRCQGGFCTPRILEILARELGIKATEVLLEHPDSWMVSERESVNRK